MTYWLSWFALAVIPAYAYMDVGGRATQDAKAEASIQFFGIQLLNQHNSLKKIYNTYKQSIMAEKQAIMAFSLIWLPESL